MKVKNKTTGAVSEIVGSYINRGASDGIIYLTDGDKSAIHDITFAELMTGYEPLANSDDEWEQKGIKSKLAKVLIAPVDYNEGDKTYFTWEEACAIEKKLNNGWRLPTRSEWVMICEEFGQKNGSYDNETLTKNLGLEYNGLIYDGHNATAGSRNFGYYWSSTPVSGGSQAYNLGFYGTDSINPSSNNYRRSGFSVRLVKDLEAQND